MRVVYLFIGFISLLLGSIGVVLPILPTTPFLLLCCYCFARSSKRIHTWFTNSSLYKKHLDSFVKDRSMTLVTKISILSFASVMLAFPLICSNHMMLKFFIVCLYVIKYYYFLFRIKTIKNIKKA